MCARQGQSSRWRSCRKAAALSLSTVLTCLVPMSVQREALLLLAEDKTTMNRCAWVVVAAAFAIATGSAEAGVVVVAGDDGPWAFSGTQNSNDKYGAGDQAAPATITATGGLSFATGTVFTIKYLSGKVDVGGGFGSFDANGDTAYVVNKLIALGSNFPSYYLPASEYPVFLGELVGTFADSKGDIVGTPFNVGDLRSVVVPAGATQLELGINDNIFRDNVGSLTMQISASGGGGAVPEPSSIILGAIATISGLGCRWLRRCKRAAARSEGRPRSNDWTWLRPDCETTSNRPA